MDQNDAESNQINKPSSRTQDKDKSFSILKSKISMTNFQMLELTNNTQKFTDRIFQLNEKGISSIQSGYYEEASIYLGQIQKVLQYAASCGRALDRQIIIKVLNNHAVLYQKSYDLQRSISYVEAIIFNLKSFVNCHDNKKSIDRLKQVSQQVIISQIQIQEIYQFLDDHHDKLKALISKKHNLALYCLQFSTLNSQNQDHFIALNYSKQAIQIFKQTFQISLNFIKIKKIIVQHENNQKTKNKKSNHKQPKHTTLQITQSQKLLEKITEISLPKLQQFDLLLNQVGQIQKVYQKKSYTSNSFTFLLQKYSDNQKKEIEYQNFSLASVMELHLQSFSGKILNDQQNLSNKQFYIQQVQNSTTLIQKVLQYSVAYFAYSVQTLQLKNETKSLPNIMGQPNRDQQNRNAQKLAQLFYIVSLKIAIQQVQQLTQFTRYLYKHYFQLYHTQKISNSTESLSKMDSLKQKYKKYLPGDNHENYKTDQEESFPDNSIQEYTQNIKISINGKDKQNKLQRLFKQQSSNTPQNNPSPPPKLNIDMSEIQSLQYGGSTTFKQNYQAQYNMQVPQIIQEQYNIKQTKKMNNLNVKKIRTVPNLSDVSSNKSQNSKSKQSKSKSSLTPKKINPNNKSKSRSRKVIQCKKTAKSISNLSKNKVQIRKFISPKINNRSQNQIHHLISYQHLPSQNNLNDNSQVDKKKKIMIFDKKINPDKKVLLLQADQLKIKKNKKPQIKLKKKKKIFISPQHSYRNNCSSKQQGEKTKRQEFNATLKEKLQEKLLQTKKINKLRKAKSFQQPIQLFQQLKQLKSKQKNLYQTNNINTLKSFKNTSKLEKNTKKRHNQDKIKHQQKMAFGYTVKFNKKQKIKKRKIVVIPQKKVILMPQNVQIDHSRPNKSRGGRKQQSEITQKRKKHSSFFQKNKQFLMGVPSNAIRMSSNANILNSQQQRNKLNKQKSSKSLYESNLGSGYLLKGLKDTNEFINNKNLSLVGTISIKRK